MVYSCISAAIAFGVIKLTSNSHSSAEQLSNSQIASDITNNPEFLKDIANALSSSFTKSNAVDNNGNGNPVLIGAQGPTGLNAQYFEGEGIIIKNDKISSVLGDSISSDEIKKDSIKSDNLADKAIINSKIANGAVTNEKLANSSIDTAKLADDSVTDNKIADNSIGSLKMIDGSINTSKIANGTITNEKLAPGVVASPLAASTVTATQIANNAVTSTKILNGAITAAKIANGTITATQLAANSVISSKLATGSVTSTKIANGAVTSTQLSNNAVTATKVSIKSVDGSKITLNGELANDLMYYNGTSWARLASGTSGQILSINASGKPVWSNLSAIAGLAKFSVYKNAAQSIPYSAATTVTWPAERYDVGNNFSTDTFTAPRAGYYHFDASGRFVSGTNPDVQTYIAINVNGLEKKRGGASISGDLNTNNDYVYAQASADIKLAAGDLVTTTAYQQFNGSVARNLETGEAISYFNGHELL